MSTKKPNAVLLSLGIVALVYTLLVGVGTVGSAFKWISGGAEGAKEMFQFARNPIVGVILGILATAVVQSSSTVTSVIVGLVAGGVPVETAIPMVMGANMGTTITNTIVSFGNISEGPAFRKSFAAATVHDFFNLYSIIIFLPLELMFHPLQRIGEGLANLFSGGKTPSNDIGDLNFIKGATKPLIDIMKELFENNLPDSAGAFVMVVAGVAMIIVSVVYMGRILKRTITSEVKEKIGKAFGKGPVMGVIYGTVITILVQSSSTTTSLIIPLAATGALTLRQVFPFTLGANIGTCITAVIAASSISGENEIAALQIALIHLAYNVIGVVLFLTIKVLKNLPIKSAELLAKKSQESRIWAFAYIFGVFFILPGVVFFTQSAMSDGDGIIKETIEQNEINGTDDHFEID